MKNINCLNRQNSLCCFQLQKIPTSSHLARLSHILNLLLGYFYFICVSVLNVVVIVVVIVVVSIITSVATAFYLLRWKPWFILTSVFCCKWYLGFGGGRLHLRIAVVYDLLYITRSLLCLTDIRDRYTWFIYMSYIHDLYTWPKYIT